MEEVGILEKLNELTVSPTAQLSLSGFLVALTVSIFTAGVVAVLYQLFYENKATGAQIHRAFLLMGPSITALFIAIQYSLPLSLGLLGALSIIRFRTPIKEPEEIAFIMLLIASSVICATFQYGLLIALLVLATIALLIQRYVGFLTVSGRRSGSVVVTTEGEEDEALLGKISDLVSEHLRSPKLEHLTATQDGNSVHYVFSSAKQDKITPLQEQLKKLASVSRVDLYFNRNADWF